MGTTRVADFAFVAQRHMHDYGTTSEQLAAVAVAQRHSATLHPRAVMGPKGEITVEQVLSSRMMAEPLHLLDCCIVNQGGGCVVVTSTTRAAEAGFHAPVVVLGWGEGHGYLDPNTAPSLTSFSGALAADDAFRAAGVARDDIDVAGVSDHFTINVVTELEDAGFCAKGEGGAFVDDGALALGGRLPTNTHGGFLSGTHAGELRALHAHRAGRAAARRGRPAPGARAPNSRSRAASVACRRRTTPPCWDGPDGVRGIPTGRHADGGAVLGGAAAPRAGGAAVRVVRTPAVRPHGALLPLLLVRGDVAGRSSGRGTIATFTVVHRAPTPAYQAEAPVHARVRRAGRGAPDAGAPGRRRSRDGRRSGCRSRSCSTTSTTI